MHYKLGFVPITAVLIALGVTLSVLTGYFVITKNPPPPSKQIQEVKTSPAPTKSPPPQPTSPQTLNQAPPPPAPRKSTGSIAIHITDSDSGKALVNSDFKLNIYSLGLNFRKENKGVSDWTLANLAPGSYKVEIFHSNSDGFPDWREKSAVCDGCFKAKNTSDFVRTSYDLDLRAGDNAELIAKYHLDKAVPLPQPDNSPKDDHKAPVTNIFYPAQGGSITYKTDGKVCAYMSAPTDQAGDYETTYFAFDGNSSFSTGTGYLCADNLANGSHTLLYYSTDKWGNIEGQRTLSFTVSIAGN